ncbi:GNAT superfamily N-acetyltransferase [Sphingomonas jinjuensis]|uniref:GNAT superfamily N-acetyltransferase n=2 Tax=Sphingomonas jinjuensis TaxID=535907 RepID=A0A840FKZ0_9SPHN|nr:GNAT superfamily N-acetyltransferase [Sphingomonas jinjuensis]
MKSGSLTPVPADQLATVVTTLEMTARPPLRPMPTSPLRLVRWQAPAVDGYRALFRRVGAPWLWYSRLAMSDATLAATIGLSGVEVYAVVDRAGIEVGMLELDLSGGDTARIAYFGLVPELAGQGHGRWLMAEAMARVWRPGVVRVVVDTCTLDHPRALGFYRAQGFVAIRRTVETFPDPRALGLLPIETAPQIPYLASRRGAA